MQKGCLKTSYLQGLLLSKLSSLFIDSKDTTSLVDVIWTAFNPDFHPLVFPTQTLLFDNNQSKPLAL